MRAVICYNTAMARRGEAVHVATSTRHYGDKVYKTHLLRRTYREGGKVKHETVGNISHLPEPVIELIRRALRGEAVVPVDSVFQIERSLPHGHVAAVLGTLRRLGLDGLIASRRGRQRDLVMAMIVARVIDPRSKLATARGLDEGANSLGEALGLQSVDENDLYAAMDWVLPRQGKIEKALAKRHLSNGTLVMCDVTSTYFEGRTCPLAQHGHDRDGKRGLLQVVFGLLCDPEGRPVAVHVFDGNTADPTTVASQVETLRKRFGLEQIVLVGDRGLLTSARIREDLAPHEGLRWITALRAPAIRKLVEGETLQLSLFDERDLAEIRDPSYPGERLIVCRNPLLAEERTRKRNELLTATERDLEAIAAATRREKRPLRGKDNIGLRVGKILDHYKVAKHFILAIDDDRFGWERDEAKIAQEAALDGIYVIRTNVPADDLSAEQTVQAYKNLSRVEAGFRCFKSVDLKVRPINHRLADRVRAHIFLCMLAYYVEWHLKERLAPLLFDDDDPAGAAARRSSIVAPARRSARAERKASTHQTEDGLPVHSFQGLLGNLATLCKNSVKAQLPSPVTFQQYTTATPLQRRALELLEVTIDL
jgi:transposase